MFETRFIYIYRSNTSVQYLPFYGGAKGQYLEVTKDSSGTTIKERIVSEDSISREQIVKNRDENLLSKVLAANLQKVQSLSNNLLILQNLGKKTGSLGKNDKAKFKEQLLSIGESSSNLIKLIDEIGEDIDILFRTMPAKKDEYEDNVSYFFLIIRDTPMIHHSIQAERAQRLLARRMW